MTAKRPPCPHCGTERRVGQVFCTTCGQRLPRLPAPPASRRKGCSLRACLVLAILATGIFCVAYPVMESLRQPVETGDGGRVTGQPTQELTGTPQIPETVPPATTMELRMFR